MLSVDPLSQRDSFSKTTDGRYFLDKIVFKDVTHNSRKAFERNTSVLNPHNDPLRGAVMTPICTMKTREAGKLRPIVKVTLDTTQ